MALTGVWAFFVFKVCLVISECGGFFEFQNWFDDKRVGLLVVVLVVYICN